MAPQWDTTACEWSNEYVSVKCSSKWKYWLGMILFFVTIFSEESFKVRQSSRCFCEMEDSFHNAATFLTNQHSTFFAGFGTDSRPGDRKEAGGEATSWSWCWWATPAGLCLFFVSNALFFSSKKTDFFLFWSSKSSSLYWRYWPIDCGVLSTVPATGVSNGCDFTWSVYFAVTPRFPQRSFQRGHSFLASYGIWLGTITTAGMMHFQIVMCGNCSSYTPLPILSQRGLNKKQWWLGLRYGTKHAQDRPQQS